MFDDELLADAAEVEEDSAATYLTMDLGGQTLGIDVRIVREIIDAQKITRLPEAPSEVLGVVDVRGESVPVVDLRSRLGIMRDGFEEDARMIVLEIATGARPRLAAIQADRVRNVEQIAEAQIEPVPSSGFGAWDASILLGLYRKDGDLTVLLDIQRLFGGAEAEIDLSAGLGFF